MKHTIYYGWMRTESSYPGWRYYPEPVGESNNDLFTIRIWENYLGDGVWTIDIYGGDGYKQMIIEDVVIPHHLFHSDEEMFAWAISMWRTA